MNFDIQKHTIFLTLHGSHAYGLSTPESDIDVKGILIPPKRYFIGFTNRFEQYEGTIPLFDNIEQMVKRPVPKDEQIDSVIYGIHKMFKLLSECNPNIIEVLFTDPSCHVMTTKFVDKLFENRDLFLTTRAKFTFAGYSHSQLRRVKLHRSWLLNPPKAKPTRADFGLPEHTVMPSDQLMAAESLIKRKVEEWLGSQEELDRATLIDIRSRFNLAITDIWSALAANAWLVEKEDFGYRIKKPDPPMCDGELDDGQLYHAAGKLLGYDDNFLQLLDRERGYRAQIKYYQQYEEWKKNRNPKRAALEEKFGFDCKHASHLVRLLRMSKEIIQLGKVIVNRPDAEELLAIKNGAWEYDKLIEWAEKEEKEVTAFYESGKSPLPKKPDYEKLDSLCQEIVEDFLEEQ